MGSKKPLTLRLSREDAEILLGIMETAEVHFAQFPEESKLQQRLKKFIYGGY